MSLKCIHISVNCRYPKAEKYLRTSTNGDRKTYRNILLTFFNKLSYLRSNKDKHSSHENIFIPFQLITRKQLENIGKNCTFYGFSRKSFFISNQMSVYFLLLFSCHQCLSVRAKKCSSDKLENVENRLEFFSANTWREFCKRLEDREKEAFFRGEITWKVSVRVLRELWS